MSLNELKEQVVRLSKSDRLALVSAIIESLQEDSKVSKSDGREAFTFALGVAEG